MSNSSNDHIKISPDVQIITLGESNVGKTSIIKRFSDNKFSLDYFNTVGVDYVNKKITIDSRDINIRVWDTAGQEKFRSIAKAYYQRADGIFIVFDVTSRESFIQNKYWINSIAKTGNGHSKIVLIGNKCDLERAVSDDEAQVFAYENNIKYFSTSAKDGTNINEAFEFLAKEALINKPKSTSEPISESNPDPDHKTCSC